MAIKKVVNVTKLMQTFVVAKGVATEGNEVVNLTINLTFITLKYFLIINKNIDMPVPKTPDHYWDIDYPTLSEQLERGYLTVATSPLFKKHCSHPRRNIFKE